MKEKSKNPVGRPLKFQSVEAMQVLMDKYFDETPEEEWTVTGLALALGTYRDVLICYQEKDEFSNAIKTAKEKVHCSYEKSLKKRGNSGDIFALKNFGWKDTQDINQNIKGGKIQIVRADEDNAK